MCCRPLGPLPSLSRGVLTFSPFIQHGIKNVAAQFIKVVVRMNVYLTVTSFTIIQALLVSNYISTIYVFN